MSDFYKKNHELGSHLQSLDDKAYYGEQPKAVFHDSYERDSMRGKRQVKNLWDAEVFLRKTNEKREPGIF